MKNQTISIDRSLSKEISKYCVLHGITKNEFFSKVFVERTLTPKEFSDFCDKIKHVKIR